MPVTITIARVVRDHTANGTISGSAILFRSYQTIRTLVLELMD